MRTLTRRPDIFLVTEGATAMLLFFLLVDDLPLLVPSVTKVSYLSAGRQNEETGRIPFHCLGTVNDPVNGSPRRSEELCDGDDDDDDDDDEDADAKYFTFCWTRAIKEATALPGAKAFSNLVMTLSNFAKFGNSAERDAIVGR